MTRTEKLISEFVPRGEVKQITIDVAIYQGDEKAYFNVVTRMFSETGDTDKLVGIVQKNSSCKLSNKDSSTKRVVNAITKASKLRWGDDLQIRVDEYLG